MKQRSILCVLALAGGCSGEPDAGTNHTTWAHYGGGPDRTRYSSLTGIDRSNVADLEIAWTYDTGDAFDGSEMQCNPIVVDGVLFVTTPKLRVIALDAATGNELWAHDPFVDPRASGPVTRKKRNRGASHWRSGDGSASRILFTADHWLIALDAATGTPDPGFGDAGRVDLRAGLGREPERLTVSATSPGTVFENLLILGSTVGESLPAAPGHVRAYDVRTGAIAWTFRTIPRPGDPGHDTWPDDAWQYAGGANCWAGSTLDAARGLVYVPTGSAAFDFYGANRHGDNLYANCLLCLHADTGKLVWHFQFVHHDVWDRDLPTAPALVEVTRDGKTVDAVAQPTKSGHVFVFDRVDGTPLFDVEEVEVPPSGIDGESLARTQPLPTSPPPFARQELTEDLLTTRTPEAAAAVRARFATLRGGPQFTPPSREGTVVFPGFDGGAEWGGPAFDPETRLLYVNANEMAWILRLVERPRYGRAKASKLYLAHCAACHREDRRGTPPEFPALLGLGDRYTVDSLATFSAEGAGRMAGMRHLGDPALRGIAAWLLGGADDEVTVANGGASPIDLRYRMDGYNKFLDPDGYPAVAPPWGTLTALDLDRGTIAWQTPLGEVPELAAQGMTGTGSENYGGPLVTKGGLVFIGATNFDRTFRAFDKATGDTLWSTLLPAGGNATPATYEVDGRQFVVIGAGGGKSGQPSGGTYVAFALPR